jgi:hypothetical protein
VIVPRSNQVNGTHNLTFATILDGVQPLPPQSHVPQEARPYGARYLLASGAAELDRRAEEFGEASSYWQRASREAVFGRTPELQNRRASTATYAAWSNPHRRPRTRLACTPRDHEAGLSAVCHPREAPPPSTKFQANLRISLTQDVCLLPTSCLSQQSIASSCMCFNNYL